MKEPEMSEFESAFLCGLINKFRPKKILEVGVAAGGTTAIILRCLEKIGQPYMMSSVDISEKYYKIPQHQSGYLAEPFKKNLKFGAHDFYLGITLPFVLDEIGGDIDFVILDTAHTLPGEVLEFLVAFPYLNKNAVVCMHDTAACHWGGKFAISHMNSHATTVLFSAVTADKFVNLIMNDDLSFTYPSIAAFQMNQDTAKYIENIFLSLVMRWRHFPVHLKAYTEMLSRHYSQEMFRIFIEALKCNFNSWNDEMRLKEIQK